MWWSSVSTGLACSRPQSPLSYLPSSLTLYWSFLVQGPQSLPCPIHSLPACIGPECPLPYLTPGPAGWASSTPQSCLTLFPYFPFYTSEQLTSPATSWVFLFCSPWILNPFFSFMFVLPHDCGIQDPIQDSTCSFLTLMGSITNRDG